MKQSQLVRGPGWWGWAGRRGWPTAMTLGGLAVMLAGCPLEFRGEDPTNAPPFTFFVAPEDTTFKNEVSFGWLATDLDSDVVAYQFQLVQTDSVFYATAGDSGLVLKSIDPPLESDDQVALNDHWSERSLDNFQTFSDLDDGWYEMRARGIDDAGSPSNPPARHRFFLFFDDIPPTPIIIDPRPGGTQPACGRITVTSWTFAVDAFDESRNATTPRGLLEFSVQLRGRSLNTCSTHLADGFTDWTFFPPGVPFVIIGVDPPTQYNDLTDPECGWEFTLRVRDPAGNVASAVCCVTRNQGC